MPSPFARSLREGNNWTPCVVLLIVILLLLGLYWWSLEEVVERKVQQRSKPSREDEIVAVLVSSTGEVEISPLHELEGTKRMFYSYAGLQYFPAFLLIHEDKKGSSSNDWAYLFETLGHQGTYYAVDLINFGRSTPGPTTMRRFIGSLEHATNVAEFSTKVFEDRNDIILVGRGSSARIVYEVARLRKDTVAGMILIAPEFDISWVESIQDIPVLLIWAQEDPIVPFTKKDEVTRNFYDVTELLFETLLPDGIAKSEAHIPEKFKVDQINQQIQDWVFYLRQYRAPR